MIVEYQIRQWLARYLHKEVSLDQFEDWFVQQSWNMHRDSDEASQQLSAAVELRLAEYSSGHLDESQLREELLPFVTSYSATVHFGQGEEFPAFSDAQNKSVTPRVFVVQGESAIFQPLADTPLGLVSL